jgi:hypothetical protein
VAIRGSTIRNIEAALRIPTERQLGNMVGRLAAIQWLTGSSKHARIKVNEETGNRRRAAIAVQWAIAVPAREMAVIVVLTPEQATGVRTEVAETVSEIVVFPAAVEVVIPVLSVAAPETALEPAVHAALRALVGAEAAEDVAVAAAAGGGELSHEPGGTHDL